MEIEDPGGLHFDGILEGDVFYPLLIIWFF